MLTSSGWQPPSIASTRSGASKVSCNILPKDPRSIFSARAISLIKPYRPSSSIRCCESAPKWDPLYMRLKLL